MVGTEMLYFAVGELGLDGGIAVTASHNPKDYTGMKIVRRGALPVGGDSGLPEIRDRALGLSGPDGGGTAAMAETVDIYPAFVDKVLSFIEPEEVKPLRVVIDAANGMAGAMLPPILDRLPSSRRSAASSSPTGRSRTMSPTRSSPRTASSSSPRSREEQADLGIAFDGDADRCFFVDDAGEFVPGDFVTALLAESMLEKEPDAKIIYDVRASWAVRDTIERAGGVPLVNRVGHAFIKHRMREENALFGGEVSGHYYFRDFHQADSGRSPPCSWWSSSRSGAARSRSSCDLSVSATSSPVS